MGQRQESLFSQAGIGLDRFELTSEDSDWKLLVVLM